MRTWNVRVHRKDKSIWLGRVEERSESLARCAALYHFGDEIADDDFDVSAA